MASDNYSVIKYSLNNGIQMPCIGLGTFRIKDADLIMRTVDYALEAGYRMFDTASVYGNEGNLKKAFNLLLPKYGLVREDIFVTSKLSPMDHGGEDIVERAYNKSLSNLGMDYLDLYLIHFPGTSRLRSEDTKNLEVRTATWAALTKLYKKGAVKSIGVSNYTVRHLDQLLKNSNGVIPAVNQVEWHPYYYQRDLLNFCKEKGIVLQAYSSLGGTSMSNNELLEERVIKMIAKKYAVTSAQVLLAWALQQDVAIIPKSTHQGRIKQNITINFKLTSEEMGAIDALGERNFKYAWDPNAVH